jgi:imidazole glycerol phosphate synthase glutamine amidotransferase subunit
VIAVLDYGAGNLRSVQNALSAIGASHALVRDAAGFLGAERVILPGVGHFGHMMRALDAQGMRGALLERIRAGVPFLGICLGLQALFATSEEAPAERGLSVYSGEVRRFRGDVRVPHMGWNRIEPRPGTRLLRHVGEKPYVYFAHSYYCPVIEETAATCEYAVPCTAAIENDNVFGVQFHPEKSGPLGLQIMRNFLEA